MWGFLGLQCSFPPSSLPSPGLRLPGLSRQWQRLGDNPRSPRWKSLKKVTRVGMCEGLWQVCPPFPAQHPSRLPVTHTHTTTAKMMTSVSLSSGHRNCFLGGSFIFSPSNSICLQDTWRGHTHNNPTPLGFFHFNSIPEFLDPQTRFEHDDAETGSTWLAVTFLKAPIPLFVSSSGVESLVSYGQLKQAGLLFYFIFLMYLFFELVF